MTPVLVPLRGDGGWRDRCWDYARRWWEEQAFGTIVTGDSPGPFSRSSARNAAAEAAGDWRVAIFADADTFMLDPSPVREAIEYAADTGEVVLPHTSYVGLTSRGTTLALDGHRWDGHIKVRKRMAPLGVAVVPRAAWDRLGGFDTRFKGWGGEDVAFRVAASTLTGLRRLPGTLVHLWHPLDKTKASYIARRGGPLRRRYSVADGDPAAMQALVEEPR